MNQLLGCQTKLNPASTEVHIECQTGQALACKHCLLPVQEAVACAEKVCEHEEVCLHGDN